MITLVLGREARSPGKRAGEGRATSPYISESHSTPGSRPTYRLSRSDSSGTYAGKTIW